METNPIVPRQRNRRADRQNVEPQPVQSAPVQPVIQPQVQQNAYPTQQIYQQQPRSMYQQAYQQQPPMAPVQPTAPAQPMPPAQPMAPAQPVVPAQPVRPTAMSYPQSQIRYPQAGYPRTAQSPTPQPRQTQQAPVQPPMVQYAPRPKTLEQRTSANSGWHQPTVREPVDVPQARATRGLHRDIARAEKDAQRKAEAQARQEEEKKRRSEEKEETKPVREKLPGWLTTALSLSFLGVLALVAAYFLMQAYLVTEEEKRVAAYEAMLLNYHVTQQDDGTLRVTWQDHVEKYAAQYNLQPAFVIAIIRNESSFRTNAVSSVGARGLMQLMPDTAEWIAGKLDDDSYNFDRMWDAETNIRYGCWYLGYLTRLFHGDAELISAAYHAGQTTVTQWLSDPAKSSDGIFLDVNKLSDGPTKQYIGRVTQTYGIYQTLLYPDEAFGASGAVSAGSSADAAADR